MLCNPLAHGGRDLGCEALQLVHRIGGWAEDERVHPSLDSELGELVHPLPSRALEETAGPVDDSPDVVDPTNPRRVAARSRRGPANPGMYVGELVRRRPAARRHPTVGRTAHQREHALAANTEPNPHVM